MMPSSPEHDRWRRIRHAAEAALAARDAEPDGLLNALLTDVEELAEARALVAESGELPDGYLEPGSTAPPVPLGDRSGERVGPWVLQRRLGRGGMGDVWLAYRADGEYERRVALKFLRADVASDEMLARFRRERQVLASLEHAGIARLIDGGVDAQGVPYLELEYVDGVAIDHWCTQQSLTLRARVTLVSAVARAVAAAHAAHVVHRDLKPANVLVDGEGRPKLLDFGIAKLLDADRDARSPATVEWNRFLTPSHAAPEQLNGGLITPATDVYGLGALLYLLTTGRLPLDVAGQPPAEAARRVNQERPQVASAVVADAAARRALSGDLDTVIATCLRKEPLRRYPEAGALADDLDRWLAGAAVRARPELWLAGLWRAARRHRVATTLAVVALVSSLVALSALVGRYREVATANRLAEARLASLRDATRTLVDDAYQALTGLPNARRATERILQGGMRIAEGHDDPELRHQIVSAWVRHARTLLSDAIAGDVPIAEAQAVAERALVLACEQVERTGRARASLSLLVDAHGECAYGAELQGDSVEVLHHSREARAAMEGPWNERGVYLELRLARSLRQVGDLQGAHDVLSRVEAMELRSRPDDVVLAAIQEDLRAIAQGERASLALAAGDGSAALAAATEAQSHHKRASAGHPHTIATLRLELSYDTLVARAQAVNGDVEAALRALRAVIMRGAQWLERFPAESVFLSDQTGRWMFESELLRQLGRPGEAVVRAREAVTVTSALTHRAGAPRTIGLLHCEARLELGRALSARGDREAAEDEFDLVLATLAAYGNQRAVNPEIGELEARAALESAMLAGSREDLARWRATAEAALAPGPSSFRARAARRDLRERLQDI